MSRGRLILTNFIGIIVVLVLIGGGTYYYFQKSNYITTDNATVSGDVYPIVAPADGKLTSAPTETGNNVSKNETIVKMDTAKGSTKVIAPTDGKIIKTNVAKDEPIAAGQQIASEVDMNKLYVIANIKEEKLKDIEVGDDVDVTVDGDGKTTIDGKVEEVGQATNSIFSLIPSTNNGNYTKVTQTVPVKISLSNYSEHVLPGMNAEVKISTKN